MRNFRRLLIVQGMLLALVSAFPVSATDKLADKPADKPILTMSGKISNKNDGGRFLFDMTALEKLPQRTFKTKTPWYPEAREFTGPLLRDVLAAVGANGKTLTAYALNDYKTTIPASDAADYDVIVARLMDGKPMPVRDKGPLFIIYPFDEKSELRSQTYYGRSAWQLKAIDIK